MPYLNYLYATCLQLEFSTFAIKYILTIIMVRLLYTVLGIISSTGMVAGLALYVIKPSKKCNNTMGNCFHHTLICVFTIDI